MGLVLGNSQAMKAAWIEDCCRWLRRSRSWSRCGSSARAPRPPGRTAITARSASGIWWRRWPWHHGHVLDHRLGARLITAEHPTIGTVQLFGQVFWLGWLMIAAMVITGVPPVILGRLKMKLARDLHDKVLYADADMNKADWMTAVGSIIGVTGIGLGLWWLDAVAALFIAVTILSDGIKNTQAAVTDLMDARAATFDDARPHPVIGEINDYLRGLDWVADAGATGAGRRARLPRRRRLWCRGRGGSIWLIWRRPGPAASIWTGACRTSWSYPWTNCHETSSRGLPQGPFVRPRRGVRGCCSHPGWPGPPR